MVCSVPQGGSGWVLVPDWALKNRKSFTFRFIYSSLMREVAVGEAAACLRHAPGLARFHNMCHGLPRLQATSLAQ